jgi:hypothetical protein
MTLPANAVMHYSITCVAGCDNPENAGFGLAFDTPGIGTPFAPAPLPGLVVQDVTTSTTSYVQASTRTLDIVQSPAGFNGVKAIHVVVKLENFPLTNKSVKLWASAYIGTWVMDTTQATPQPKVTEGWQSSSTIYTVALP